MVVGMGLLFYKERGNNSFQYVPLSKEDSSVLLWT